MAQLYEGMFLLDNEAVRRDWAQAKGSVLSVLERHGAKVLAARRWDERRLAYKIRGRKRGTYLLGYFEQSGAGTSSVRRDLDITESLLRYLIVRADSVPEGELEKSQAELEAGFAVPPPPTDEEPESEGTPVEIDENAPEAVEEESEASSGRSSAGSDEEEDR
jgi:small subunit ribosomal protein S6